MDPTKMIAFRDELEKVAGMKDALVGAGIGAAITGTAGGLKEWEKRIQDDRLNYTPEQKQHLKKRRRNRMIAGVATGATTGALAGHFVGKAGRSLKHHAEGLLSTAKKEGKEVVDAAGHRLDKFNKEFAEQTGKAYADANRRTVREDLPAAAKKITRQVKRDITPKPYRRAKIGVKRLIHNAKKAFRHSPSLDHRS